MTPQLTAVDPHRAAALNGMRDLVAFLEAHPHVPAPRVITYTVQADNDLDGAERLARIAHHMEARVMIAPDRTQRAVRAFSRICLVVQYFPLTLGDGSTL